MTLLKITLKSLYRKNSGNKSLIACMGILLLLPVLLYSISSSVANQVGTFQKEVFGAFSDILYEPEQYGADSLDYSVKETDEFLNGFTSLEIGTLSTVHSEDLTDSRKLNVGYADEIGIKLSAVNLLKGRLPEASSEIALTESVAEHYDADLNSSITVFGKEYTVCGIAADYGRLWVHGEQQEKQKVSPINAFITKEDAESLLKATGTLTRQILLIQSPENIIIQKESSYHFINTALSVKMNFKIPAAFAVIVLLVSLVVIFLILVLNGKKLQKRIANYYRIGFTAKMIRGVIYWELLLCLLIGGILSGIFSLFGTHVSVFAVSKYIGQPLTVSYDYNMLLISFAAFFIGVSVIAPFYARLETRKAIKTVCAENVDKTKKIRFKKRFSFNLFIIKKYKKSYLLLTLTVIFSCVLISYGIFYGNYFRSDVTERAPGTLPRDYDFQFVANTKNAAPWGDNSDPIIFFTNTYEKLGAKQELIDKLQNDNMANKIKAYRENNKYAVLLDQNQLTPYIDASDFYEDGEYNGDNFHGFSFMKNNSHLHYEKFGYNENDLLVSADILGYPEDVLKELERSVVEGEINIDKIKSGEEIILRVPAFKITAFDNGMISMEKTNPDEKNAYNDTTFKVGDTVNLTALLTDEMINGAVPQSYLDKFYREDITVKIGAIIRNTDGILYQNGTFGQTYSFLTVNEAFEKLGVKADYSIVSIYGNGDYSDASLVGHFSEYVEEITTSGGNMVFENWITDTKTNKIYNMIIDVFVVMLTAILCLTTLIIMTSQFYNITKFSAKNRALLRLNGLPLRNDVVFIIAGAVVVSAIGGLVGMPISLAAIVLLGIDAPFDLIRELFYYFPPLNIAYVFSGVMLISLFSVLPSVVSVLRCNKNVVEGINGE